MWEVLTRTQRHDEFWALRDVSFEVRRGEVVGIVGSNGAGKSTLLKLIAGTLDKTSGQVDVSGKISAVLELGTSFNAEMTGRENVMTALAYRGISKEKVAEKFEWIVSFSELLTVIDNPFRTYSSGMKARLTFSTAVASMENILLIDEALAAGDMAFVNKALRYLERICREEHVSALIVSHSMSTLMRLCDRGIYLRQGRVVSIGAIEDVAREYETVMLADDEALFDTKQETNNENEEPPGSGIFKILDVEFLSNGSPTEYLQVGEDAEVLIHFESERAFDDVLIGLEIHNVDQGVFVTRITNRSNRMGD